MLESIRRVSTFPRLSSFYVLAPGIVATFLWLLANDQIHPFAIYVAQLYLLF